MTTFEEDIIKLYAEGLNVTQIFNELEGEIDERGIKFVLGQYSKPYRDMQVSNDKSPAPAAPPRPKDELDIVARQSVDVITDEDHNEIVNRIKNIALGSEDEHVALRAAKFLFEEKTGRNKALVKNKNKLNITNINVLQINEDLKKGRARLAEIESQFNATEEKQTIAI